MRRGKAGVEGLEQVRLYRPEMSRLRWPLLTRRRY